jgi:hypothetical protein
LMLLIFDPPSRTKDLHRASLLWIMIEQLSHTRNTSVRRAKCDYIRKLVEHHWRDRCEKDRNWLSEQALLWARNCIRSLRAYPSESLMVRKMRWYNACLVGVYELCWCSCEGRPAE